MDIEYYEEDGSPHFKFSNFKRKKDNSTYLHQPNIMDGGWIISGKYAEAEKKYYVTYLQDSFAASRIQDEIAFDIETGKDYIVYFDNKHRLRLKGGQFTRTYHKPTPEEIRARYEQQEKERQERLKQLDLEGDMFVPETFLRLIRLSNPQCVKNKIFTEFAKESNEENCGVFYVKNDQENKTEEELAKLIPAKALIDSMTKKPTTEEVIEGIEQLYKIIRNSHD